MLEGKMLPDNEYWTLAHRIRWLLDTCGLKQAEFARSLGISANYVYLLTSGRKETISEPLALLIEHVYGCPAEWVRTGRRPDPPAADAALQADTIRRIGRLSDRELQAVADFLCTIEAERL